MQELPRPFPDRPTASPGAHVWDARPQVSTLPTWGVSPPRPRSGKTYSYLFSYPSRMPLYPSWMEADHGDDLQYVFGKPFATPLGYRAQDRTISKIMIAYWTNFARTG